MTNESKLTLEIKKARSLFGPKPEGRVLNTSIVRDERKMSEYTVEKFSDEMNDALAVYVTDLAEANEKYLSSLEGLMGKAKGLDVKRVLDIVSGLQVRANAVKQRMG